MSILHMIGFFAPILLMVMLLLSTADKSLGARKSYVHILVKIFEYSCKKTEKGHKSKRFDMANTSNKSKRSCKSLRKFKETEAILAMKNENQIDGRNALQDNADLFMEYLKRGMEVIVEDEVTSCFMAQELKNWNLLTRTYRDYKFTSVRIAIIWISGCIFRYCFLLPTRLIIFGISLFGLIACTFSLGCLKDGPLKTKLSNFTLRKICILMSAAMSGVIIYHNKENRPKSGICVANHTSPIDVLVLLCDNMYSLIGQRHEGVLGLFQKALGKTSPQIWFERSESKDRHLVFELLKKHVSDPNNPPILIFPEGTCINNTSVMQFKKGSFEVGSVIYPVAIKYDSRFGDAFWNSSKYSMIHYIYLLVTSWAIVCDVWYLPPMIKEEEETSIDFANRVKSVIAKKGGLVDLAWDGQLKRMQPKKEWKEMLQKEITKQLTNTVVNSKTK